MKISEHFDVREFVSEYIFYNYANKSQWFVRQQIVDGAEAIREHFDAPLYVNDWYRGGHLQERGYRVPSTKTGSSLSQHKLSNAIDFNIQGLSSDMVYEDVLNNQQFYLDLGFTTIEHKKIATSWTHLDMRWTGLNEIKIVLP